MRRINLFGAPAVRDQAARAALLEIERASADESIVDIAAAFTITGSFTERRTLDVTAATLAETREFIATLVGDLKRGGSNRSS